MIKKIDSLFLLDDKRSAYLRNNEFKKLEESYKIPIKLTNENTGKFWTEKFSINPYVDDHMTKDRIETVSRLVLKYSTGDLLNIGTGDASLEQILNRKGFKYRIIGQDITLDTLLRVSKSNDFIPLIGDINFLPFKKKKFQTITVLEVLEHMLYSDIFSILGNIKEILKKNGIFIVSVPLNESYSGEHNPNRHYRRYSSDLIRYEITKSGFDILHQEYLSAFSSNYYLKKFLSRNIFKKRWESNVTIIVAQKR